MKTRTPFVVLVALVVTAPIAACSGQVSTAEVYDATAGDSSADSVVDSRIDQSAEDAAPDGPDPDATLDAVADVTPDEAPSPLLCGDGYRDPLTEECDDGLGNIPESRACTDACVVVDRLVKDDEAYLRGLEIHHVASGPSGHAIMLSEMPQYNGTRSPIVFFDSAGRRISTLDDYYQTLALAPLPDGSFAAADSETSGIGGLALYKISGAGDSSTLVSWFDYNPECPAAVWSGSELFVAWHDWVSGSVCTQRFDAELSALADATCSDGGVWDLSISADGSLGAVGWREDSDTGRIFVKGPGWSWESAELAQETHWRKPPALAFLPGGLLMVVATEGDGIQKGTVLDGGVELAPFEAFTQAARYEPSLAVTPDGIYLAWSDTIGDIWNTWIQKLEWTGSKIDATTHAPIPLPRNPDHRVGEQRFPVLVPTYDNGLLAVWLDFTTENFVGQAYGGPDVVMELIPTPIVRGAPY